MRFLVRFILIHLFLQIWACYEIYFCRAIINSKVFFRKWTLKRVLQVESLKSASFSSTEKLRPDQDRKSVSQPSKIWQNKKLTVYTTFRPRFCRSGRKNSRLLNFLSIVFSFNWTRISSRFLFVPLNKKTIIDSGEH